MLLIVEKEVLDVIARMRDRSVLALQRLQGVIDAAPRAEVAASGNVIGHLCGGAWEKKESGELCDCYACRLLRGKECGHPGWHSTRPKAEGVIG